METIMQAWLSIWLYIMVAIGIVLEIRIWSQNHRLSQCLEIALKGHNISSANRALKKLSIAERLQTAAPTGRLFYLLSFVRSPINGSMYSVNGIAKWIIGHYDAWYAQLKKAG